MTPGTQVEFEDAVRIRDSAASGELPFVARVRLRAKRRVLWMRALWAAEQSSVPAGLAISHAEVDRITEAPQEMAAREALFYEQHPEACRLTEQIEDAERQMAEHPNWRRICDAFDLSHYEVELLCLAVTVEIDPLLRRVYGYLHDDAGAVFATPWLASVLFQWPAGVHVGPESSLLRWRLARPADGVANPWAMSAPWIADPDVALWSVRGTAVDPALASAVRIYSVTDNREAICLYPAQLSAMEDFVRSLWSGAGSSERTAPMEIEIVGPSGAGKRALAAQFCRLIGVDMICVDLRQLLPGDTPRHVAIDRAVRAARIARLAGGVLYWHGHEPANVAIGESIRGHSRLVIVGSESPLDRKAAPSSLRRTLQLPSLTRAARLALWKQQTDVPAPAIVSDSTLTPAQIVRAAHAAPAGPEAVAEICQVQLDAGPLELFMPLVCPFTWDDIILPPAVREHLAEFEQQIRLRWQVYEDWGFSRLCPLGAGITAMFAGPSGTGKTMAAQVLARSLGMKLYRIDLAGVINKYIGETEKRLKQVFETCERSNAMLFFDEADALFGQRMQVKDAHDRFANIEIDYLLQRMEQFEGVAILATNRKSDLDKAFLRRLRFIVDFLQPGPPERAALWRRVLPAQAANGEKLLREDLDWELLASRLNMSGADITATALDAAFLAYAQQKRIGMEHVLHAARRTMSKQGIVLRPGDLGT
jgi:hypothetical protein